MLIAVLLIDMMVDVSVDERSTVAPSSDIKLINNTREDYHLSSILQERLRIFLADFGWFYKSLPLGGFAETL